MPSDPSILSVRMPDGHFEQVEKISCSTLFPRKFYSFKAEFEENDGVLTQIFDKIAIGNDKSLTFFARC
ncbi:MAG: hypothetical protein EWV90_16575 [Microcystis aeruginosa Ma_QC_Ch_20071001_M135]|nr:MAG: hypothetical protein EWV90_16575 [Microcystis aeruginosa Ma_QC_Ch_20071001_M135]